MLVKCWLRSVTVQQTLHQQSSYGWVLAVRTAKFYFGSRCVKVFCLFVFLVKRLFLFVPLLEEAHAS